MQSIRYLTAVPSAASSCRVVANHGDITQKDAEDDILAKARAIISKRLRTPTQVGSPAQVVEYLQIYWHGTDREQVVAIWLDAGNAIVGVEELATGTIDTCAIYPREIVKSALAMKATGVIIAHNHPSGRAAHSDSDKFLAKRLRAALSLVDIRFLDSVVVASCGTESLAAIGQLPGV